MALPIMLPEDLYARVAEQAAQQGKTPDELVRAVTEAYLQAAPSEMLVYDDVPGYDPALDPLAPFTGKYLATVTDLSLHHDEYLAQEASDPHAGE